MINNYNNLNFYIDPTNDYEENGRNQTKEEADKIGNKILDMLNSNKISYYRIKQNEENKIIEFVRNKR